MEKADSKGEKCTLDVVTVFSFISDGLSSTEAFKKPTARCNSSIQNVNLL